MTWLTPEPRRRPRGDGRRPAIVAVRSVALSGVTPQERITRALKLLVFSSE
jgi:hypothetical protein